VFSRPADVVVAASVGVENVVAGTVVETADGLATVRVGDDGSIRAAADVAPGPVFACIRAEDVTLERSQPRDVSARNQWTGRVVALQSEGSVVRVTVDCGFVLTALITRPSLDELRVATGSTVTALVKATAVHLVQRGST
jgi:molybdate transport system ATP-binding protein